jgi:hypothetical protein
LTFANCEFGSLKHKMNHLASSLAVPTPMADAFSVATPPGVLD